MLLLGFFVCFCLFVLFFVLVAVVTFRCFVGVFLWGGGGGGVGYTCQCCCSYTQLLSTRLKLELYRRYCDPKQNVTLKEFWCSLLKTARTTELCDPRNVSLDRVKGWYSSDYPGSRLALLGSMLGLVGPVSVYTARARQCIWLAATVSVWRNVTLS